MKKMEKKNYFKACLSVFGTMCVAELISLLLMFLSFSFAGNGRLGLWITQIISAFLFFGMIYGAVWCIGDSDRNKVNFSKQKKDVFRGLKIGLALMLPQLIMNILLVIDKLGASFSFFGMYKVLNSHIWPLISLMTFTGANKPPYYIMEIADVFWPDVAVFASTMLLIPLICTFAYIMGFHGFTLKHKIVYKSK